MTNPSPARLISRLFLFPRGIPLLAVLGVPSALPATTIASETLLQRR